MNRRTEYLRSRRHAATQSREGLPRGVPPKVVRFLEKYENYVLAALVGILALLLYALYPRVASLVVAWTSSSSEADDALVVEAPVEPDMFVMAMRWAPSTCAFQPDARACAGYQRRGVQQSHTFSLAGFWPENDEKGLLLSCSNEKFSTKAIAHLIGRLRMAWPSFSRFSDPTGWSREWARHGTCAWPVLRNVTSYFEAAFNAYRTLDAGAKLLTWQDAHGGSEATLSVADMDGLLLGGGDAQSAGGAADTPAGARLVVKCLTHPELGRVVDQVWLCVDKMTLLPVPCSAEWTAKQTGVCDSQFRAPAPAIRPIADEAAASSDDAAATAADDEVEGDDADAAPAAQ